VGWKALAVNVSDIAAMGGAPTFGLVTLALPADTPVEHIDDVYAGLGECAEVYGVTVAGGDIVSAPVVSITVALMGQALTGSGGQPLLLRRNAAKDGDLIAVTGPLGAPAGGLRALREGEASRYPTLVEAHMRPQPRVDAAKAAVMAGLHCGIDISDGLVRDVGHICEQSRVRSEIDAPAVPVDDNLLLAYPEAAAVMALTGGEDYELVLVGAELSLRECAGMLREATPGAQLHVIGRVTMGPPGVHVLDADGREIEVGSGGFDHLGGDEP
jgi:thiamine-monophosphate kinase